MRTASLYRSAVGGSVVVCGRRIPMATAISSTAARASSGRTQRCRRRCGPRLVDAVGHDGARDKGHAGQLAPFSPPPGKHLLHEAGMNCAG